MCVPMGELYTSVYTIQAHVNQEGWKAAVTLEKRAVRACRCFLE